MEERVNVTEKWVLTAGELLSQVRSTQTIRKELKEKLNVLLTCDHPQIEEVEKSEMENTDMDTAGEYRLHPSRCVCI